MLQIRIQLGMIGLLLMILFVFTILMFLFPYIFYLKETPCPQFWINFFPFLIGYVQFSQFVKAMLMPWIINKILSSTNNQIHDEDEEDDS